MAASMERVGRTIETITCEIQFYKNQAAQSIWEIGKRLIEAKDKLTHGDWQAWLAEQVDIPERTAQRFMQLAREYPNPTPVSQLGMTKALLLLSVPSEDREGFMEETRQIDGQDKAVADMSKRELEKVIQERDDARRQAEEARTALAEQLDEQQRVYDTDMETARNEAEAAAGRAAEAQSKIEDLRRQLAELERQPPVEVLAPDAEALEAATAAARAEIEDKLKKKLEKAEAAKIKAEQEQQLLRESLESQQRGHTAEKELLSQQAQELAKKLAVAASTGAVVFKTHFEAAQVSVNKMLGVLGEIEDIQLAGKLRQALCAFCSSVLETVAGDGHDA